MSIRQNRKNFHELKFMIFEEIKSLVTSHQNLSEAKIFLKLHAVGRNYSVHFLIIKLASFKISNPLSVVVKILSS